MSEPVPLGDVVAVLKSLPELLREARGEMTVLEAGRSIGISPAHVTQIELGKRQPSVPTAIRLLEWIGDHGDREVSCCGGCDRPLATHAPSVVVLPAPRLTCPSCAVETKTLAEA
jgi:DNA-binding XRE family transcriptional regulator